MSMYEQDMEQKQAQWRNDLKEMRMEEDKHVDKHIIVYALLSLLAAICAVWFGPFVSLAGFLINVQVYRYFRRNQCFIGKTGCDMKVFAIVAGVSYIFTMFVPYFIDYAYYMEYGILRDVLQTIYGIAALCVILNTAYISVYLLGARKNYESV